MNNEYWIEISLMGDYTADRIQQAVNSAWKVHNWTLNQLKEKFLETLRTPTNQEIKLNLSRYIKEEGLGKHTQRYTLDAAAEKAAAEFRNTLKVGELGQVDFPQPVEESEYTDIDIQVRKIWKRYLAQYGGISTTYGMLMLEGEWKFILAKQAANNKIVLAHFPNLWRDVTLRHKGEKNWIKFNLYEPDSPVGKMKARMYV